MDTTKKRIKKEKPIEPNKKVSVNKKTKSTPKKIVDAKPKLTLKQKLFCDRYLVLHNATQAAIEAGYSKKTAGVIADQNLKKLYIRAYIDSRLDELDVKNRMEATEVVERLTNIARREEMEHIPVTTTTREERWINLGTPKKPNWKKEVTQVTKTGIVDVPSRLNDTNKSLELLGKYHNIFKERLEVDANINSTNKLSQLIESLTGSDDEEE